MHRRNSNERSLKEALEALVDDYGLRGKLDEQAVRAAWTEVAGEMIARHTMSMALRRGKLTVKVDSAPLREELGFMRTMLMELLNGRFEREVVTEIRID
jgi:predicted nucleic acid-binding Zn ribbon protein